MNRQFLILRTGPLEGTKMARTSSSVRRWTIHVIVLFGPFTLIPVVAQAQNIQPVADAGPLRYAGPGPIVLDGSHSYDPDNSGALSYTWRQTAGPAVVVIDENIATPTIAGSLELGMGRFPTLEPQGFPQTDEVQECEFELVVDDGELTSLPDTVKVVIVPNFGPSTLRLANPPFRPDRPTGIYFAGGDCATGFNEQLIPLGPWVDWHKLANWIDFPQGYTPDTSSPEPWRTYYRYGDMIIAYLSSIAAEYTGMIQIIGGSTGGQPAVDAAIRLNRYRDPRYAVNQVTEMEAPCRWQSSWAAYLASNELLHSSAVDGEILRHEHYWGETYRLTNPPRDLVGIYLEGHSHPEVMRWYKNSLTFPAANQFNHGVVAGAFWSVVGPGRNLQPSAEAIGYCFRWTRGGAMVMLDENIYPGRFPAPVTLVGPIDVGDPNGFVLTCEESENAVGYELLLGTDPHRVMDYETVSDTPGPPDHIVTAVPEDGIWWTVRVRDQYGSTIYADPNYYSAVSYDPEPADGSLHVETAADLRWSAGLRSSSYTVYFGDHFDDVNDGTASAFRSNQTATYFTVGSAGLSYPDGLVPGATYFWRIDDVGSDGTVIHRGKLWRFTVWQQRTR